MSGLDPEKRDKLIIYVSMLRKTVKGSYRQKLGIFPNEFSTEDILRRCNTENINQVVAQQQCKFIAQLT